MHAAVAVAHRVVHRTRQNIGTTMIDEIDYFPRRDRHNKKKKTDSGWGDLKKQKSEQDAKAQKARDEKREGDQNPAAENLDDEEEKSREKK